MREYANDPYANITPTVRKHTAKLFGEIISVMKIYYRSGHKVLDVGERNPLADRIEEELNVKLDSTLDTDFDFEIKAPGKDYDIILFSHVIEHLINPLFALCELKKLLKPNGVIIIAHPTRYKKYKIHYHEIPLDDLEVLIHKAGMQIILQKTYFSSFKWSIGIRPIIRRLLTLLWSRNHITVVRKK